MNSQEIAQLDDILQQHDYNRTLLIAIMQDIQKVYHYLPEEALCYIARKLNLSEAKIYGVATFYENFSLEPKGKSVTEPPAMYGNLCRSWMSSGECLG